LEPTTPSPPVELHRQCRVTILKCSEFDTNASLQAVFVTNELRPFRSRLPEASSKSERVDACLAFLMDKRLSDGRSVLPLFLAALRDRYQTGDALRDELETLQLKAGQELNTKAALSEMQGTKPEGVSPANYGSTELASLAKLIAESYNILELVELAQSVGLYVSALPVNEAGMSREIVLFANRQGRLDELRLRLKADGKL
jgi:hypothetical protein